MYLRVPVPVFGAVKSIAANVMAKFTWRSMQGCVYYAVRRMHHVCRVRVCVADCGMMVIVRQSADIVQAFTVLIKFYVVSFACPTVVEFVLALRTTTATL